MQCEHCDVVFKVKIVKLNGCTMFRISMCPFCGGQIHDPGYVDSAR